MRKIWRKIKGTVRGWIDGKTTESETHVGDSYLREVTIEIPLSDEGSELDLEKVRRRILEFPYVIPYSEPKITRTTEGSLQLTVEMFDSRQAGKLREVIRGKG